MLHIFAFIGAFVVFSFFWTLLTAPSPKASSGRRTPMGHTPPNAIPVVFRGEEYPSIAAACRAHKVTREVVIAEGEFDD